MSNRDWYLYTLSIVMALATGILLNVPELLAGQYNPKANIGDQATAWKNLPGVDDKQHSLDDLANRDVLVVVFTCNSCPYAVDYEERINRLASRYSEADSRVGVVAINVNKIEADQLPAMRKRARERRLVYPYLYDETQEIAKAYGAVRTPEFFVLDKARRIVYMGAMDDNTKASEVKVRYVEDAIEATLQGKSPKVLETPPVGCAIRYARQRSKP